MKIQPSLYYLGMSCFPISILSLINIFYSYYFEYLLDVNSYVVVLVLSLTIGITFILFGKSKKDEIGIYEQIFLVFLIYIFCSFFILIPFYMSSYNISFIDSYFESISGLTGTGFSTLADIKNLDPPLIIWRSSSQWLGSFLFLIFLVLIFSNKQINFKMTEYVYNFEKKINFSKNLLNVSYRIFFIYLFLTLIIFILLSFSGLRIFNSLNLSMTLISSGGFLPTKSLNDIITTNLQLFVLTISFLIPIFNFYIMYNIFFNRNDLKYHGEDLYLLFIFLSFSLIFYLLNNFDLLSVFTNVLSSIGNSGLSTTSMPNNFNLFFLILVICGGSVLSSTSGIKFIRIYILVKAFILEIYRLVKPNIILDNRIMFTDKKINKDNIRIAFLIFILFFLSLLILSSILLIDIFDFESSFKLSVLTITNTTTSSIYGLEGVNFSSLLNLSKISLIIFMIIAKIELLAVFLIIRKVFAGN